MPSIPPLDLYYATSLPFRHYVFIPPLAFHCVITPSFLHWPYIPLLDLHYSTSLLFRYEIFIPRWRSVLHSALAFHSSFRNGLPYFIPHWPSIPCIPSYIKFRHYAYLSGLHINSPSDFHSVSSLRLHIQQYSHILCLPVQLFCLNLLHAVNFFTCGRFMIKIEAFFFQISSISSIFSIIFSIKWDTSLEYQVARVFNISIFFYFHNFSTKFKVYPFRQWSIGGEEWRFWVCSQTFPGMRETSLYYFFTKVSKCTVKLLNRELRASHL